MTLCFEKVDETRESLVSRYPFVLFPVQHGVLLGTGTRYRRIPVVMAGG